MTENNLIRRDSDPEAMLGIAIVMSALLTGLLAGIAITLILIW